MKNLLLAALGIFLMTAVLESCKDHSLNSTGPMPMNTSQASSSSTANPAITYNKQNVNGQWAICVMDTDGSHQTMVWSYGISGSVNDGGWSPTASSILIQSSANGIDSLNAIDISVNSSGVPVASNYRNIMIHNNAQDTTTMSTNYSWSSTSGVNKIAYGLSPNPGSLRTYPTLASINLVS